MTPLLLVVGHKLPQRCFPFSTLRGTPRVLCFRSRPIFLGWSAAPPIPPVTGRGFRVKVDQFPSLAPTRALGHPGVSDSSRVQPAVPDRGLRQGRYGDEAPGQSHWTSRGGASLPAPDRRPPHSFCQMRDAEGRSLKRGSANGWSRGGRAGCAGGWSSAPSRGAASRWGDREASAGAWAASGV